MNNLQLNIGNIITSTIVQPENDFATNLPDGGIFSLGDYTIDLKSTDSTVIIDIGLVVEGNQLATAGDFVQLTITKNTSDLVYTTTYNLNSETQVHNIYLSYTDTAPLDGTSIGTSPTYSFTLQLVNSPPTLTNLSLERLSLLEVSSPTVVPIDFSTVF